MRSPPRPRPARPIPSVTMSAATRATSPIAATSDGSIPNQVAAGWSGAALGWGLPVPPVPPPLSLGSEEGEPSGAALSPAVVEAPGEAASEELGAGLGPVGCALGAAGVACGAPLGAGTAAVVKCVQKYSRSVRPEAWIAAASSRPT